MTPSQSRVFRSHWFDGSYIKTWGTPTLIAAGDDHDKITNGQFAFKNGGFSESIAMRVNGVKRAA